MFSTNQLHKLSEAKLDINNKQNLVDIKTLNVDTTLNRSDRIIQYVNAVHNPYLFRVGDTAVRVKYGKGNRTLQESVANYCYARALEI